MCSWRVNSESAGCSQGLFLLTLESQFPLPPGCRASSNLELPELV
ncbi:hypothetical protein PITC_023880 [Penicillium italicum]|uniref:Uncharacterized protein n=1 Tax=Penicillium italicum TaxID=40296 RepID=A0A0A2LD90_PENIT|nr:hypothetical protein PITC_023880 [Penicillium italicum]